MAITKRDSSTPPVAEESLVTPVGEFDTSLMRIMLYGQAKVGKTTAAYRVSEFWDGKLPPSAPVRVEDCFSISIDRNATIGMRAAGIDIPEVDVRKLMARGTVKNIRDGVRKAIEEAHNHVETKGVRNVIVDTVSALDSELIRFWGMSANIPRSENGTEDKRGMFGEVLNSHRAFWSDVDFLNCRVIFLCHADVMQESVKARPNDAEKAKLATVTLAGTDTDIKPQITGKALDLYMRNVDLIMPVKMYGEAGTNNCNRVFLPFGGGGMAGGNRFHFALKQEEPADLGALLKKIARP